MSYLELVGEVQDNLTLAQLEDLEAIISAELRVRLAEYKQEGAEIRDDN